MVVIHGWQILQDCTRGDWSISSAAVGRLKDALLLRLNLDRPEIAAAWIKPEIPFLLDAIRHMLPFLEGTNIPKTPTNGRRQHVDQGDTTDDGRDDLKHIEWTRTSAAQCVALCWSMGAAVRLVETTEGVDLFERVIDSMVSVVLEGGSKGKFREQCVGALAVLRISLSVEMKVAKEYQIVDTSAVRTALVSKCDASLLQVQDEFPDVQAVVSTHAGSGGKGGKGGRGGRGGSGVCGALVWWSFVLTCACCVLFLLAAYVLKAEAAVVVVRDVRFPKYACGMVSLLALAYMYGNAMFDWSGGSGVSGAESELGAVANFVLRQGGGGGDIKATKVA